MLLIKVSYKGRKQTSVLQREIKDYCLIHWDEITQLIRSLSDNAFKFLICLKVADPLGAGKEFGECFNIFYNVLEIMSLEEMDGIFKELNQWGYIFVTTYKDAPIVDKKEEAALQSFYNNTYFQQSYKNENQPLNTFQEIEQAFFKASKKQINAEVMQTTEIANFMKANKNKLAAICGSPSIPEPAQKLDQSQIMLLGYLKGISASSQCIVVNPEQINALSTAFQVAPAEVSQALMTLCCAGYISITVDSATVQVN